MENVQEIRVFNFTKENADGVKLHLGETYTVKHDQCNNEDAKFIDSAPFCYRWMITSKNSPLPIRNGKWFQGFAAQQMIKWFTDHGYVLQSIVDHRGNILYQASREEKSKTEAEIRFIENGFYKLVKTGNKLSAVNMYRSLYGGDLDHARDMIDDIVRQKEEA